MSEVTLPSYIAFATKPHISKESVVVYLTKSMLTLYSVFKEVSISFPLLATRMGLEPTTSSVLTTITFVTIKNVCGLDFVFTIVD